MSKQLKKKSYNSNSKQSNRSGKSSSSTQTTSKFGFVWVGSTIPPMMRQSDNKVFTMIQDMQQAVFTQTTVTPYLAAQLYQFSYIDQYASLSVIFDQYKYDMIEVTIRPTFTSNPLSESGIAVPLLSVVVDYDDATTPTSIAYLREYSNCTQSLYETVVRRFVPHIAVASYNSSFSGYTNIIAPWIDCSSSTVQHYGLKFGIDPANASQTALQTYTVSTRVKLSFRNVH